MWRFWTKCQTVTILSVAPSDKNCIIIGNKNQWKISKFVWKCIDVLEKVNKSI